ncbi:hypothetical protein WICPIJ_009748 [Wickerhamomyces pijperi]|uniref:Partial AB-hydrolase lipase domain-containing protein n=1 Tax=Wickerhamomyces pijperi TaxID=599730 RepID=A0A9P8TCH8_WICPI|nr:hypothetical protein WICPIJ_009748 [Wickerhamomyces pijperi]
MIDLQPLKTFITALLYIILYVPLKAIQYLTHKTAATYLEDITHTDPKLLSILNAKDIKELCAIHGFGVHEHVVITEDGYLLAIHRIYKDKPSTLTRGKPVVYFHHGLLTNSELFVLGDTRERSLPFRLVEQGYDVWLGNNRGNKYSRKHLKLKPSKRKFWDFSLDEFAIYDIPDTINYILSYTGVPDLTYVGFSQGSAQCFASLSVNPQLRKKINKFIGLSPAMIPKDLNTDSPIVDFFINSSPNMLFWFFGEYSILPSVLFWQRLFGNYYYEKVVDYSLKVLFCWESKNMSANQKLVGYPHMFSTTSVKTVVHWFQVIKDKNFIMYNDEMSANLKLNRCVSFPIESIQDVPMVLIYGESDLLIDIGKTKEKLWLNMANTRIIGVPGYEHMDLIWAEDVEYTVFQPVFQEIRDVYESRDNNNETVSVAVNEDTSSESGKDEESYMNVKVKETFSGIESTVPGSQGSLFV